MAKQIPDNAARPCTCGQGTLRPVPGTDHYDSDRVAMVDMACDAPTCQIESFHSWIW
jgi:hypothetical protein